MANIPHLYGKNRSAGSVLNASGPLDVPSNFRGGVLNSRPECRVLSIFTSRPGQFLQAPFAYHDEL